VAGRLRPPRYARARPTSYARHARYGSGAWRRRLLMAALALPVIAVIGVGLVGWSQGYRLYVVHTGSMDPTYRPGDVVLDAPAAAGYRPGQVITFRHSALTTDVVTHRVVAVRAAGITTKGDANATPDAWTIRPAQVQGRTVGAVPRLGYLVVYLQQPQGVLSILTAAASIMLLWGICFPAVVRRDEPDLALSQLLPRPFGLVS
jgi:signal peptidase I